ncbi:hypothetical protein PFLUV_G00171190 [Perca fluviatilis]|uniref:Uncharacterized protein n=1 Tax=Perca fluviatilis TaxID=8168 RepID=A0A6A5EPW1_PERFL|nr:hypothetical protein PFLUV_G00171190 [Perca fluviatilis]
MARADKTGAARLRVFRGRYTLCHFCASIISGLVTTAASMPVDIVKTRIRNMKMIDGKPEYNNGVVSYSNSHNFI